MWNLVLLQGATQLDSTLQAMCRSHMCVAVQTSRQKNQRRTGEGANILQRMYLATDCKCGNFVALICHWTYLVPPGYRRSVIYVPGRQQKSIALRQSVILFSVYIHEMPARNNVENPSPATSPSAWLPLVCWFPFHRSTSTLPLAGRLAKTTIM